MQKGRRRLEGGLVHLDAFEAIWGAALQNYFVPAVALSHRSRI